jgi:hypothetical protein
MQLQVAITTADRISREFFSSWLEEWFAVQLPFSLADVHVQQSEVAQVLLLPVNLAIAKLEAAGSDDQVKHLRAAAAKLGQTLE